MDQRFCILIYLVPVDKVQDHVQSVVSENL
jgi:hypothetical protein